MEKSRREGSGMLTITAEKDHGKDSANVKVWGIKVIQLIMYHLN